LKIKDAPVDATGASFFGLRRAIKKQPRRQIWANAEPQRNEGQLLQAL
jgi:hypothetical protein